MSAQVGREIESRRIVLDVETDGRSDEVEVRYFDAGEQNGKPPVVLCHGIGLDAAAVSWKHALPTLASDRRVLAFDFPGHGESDKPTRSYTTAFYNHVLDAFLDSFGIGRVVLVGISMGGAVALGHTLRVPEQVSALVLVDSHGLGRDAPWRAPGLVSLWTPFFDVVLERSLGDRATIATALSAMTVDLDSEFVTDVGRTVNDGKTVRALTSWQRSEFGSCGLRTCYLDRLDEVTVPTLLVHGRDDPVFPVTWSERAAERIVTSSLHVIDQCGHWPPREHPAEFNRVVSEFLASEAE